MTTNTEQTLDRMERQWIRQLNTLLLMVTINLALTLTAVLLVIFL